MSPGAFALTGARGPGGCWTTDSVRPRSSTVTRGQPLPRGPCRGAGGQSLAMETGRGASGCRSKAERCAAGPLESRRCRRARASWLTGLHRARLQPRRRHAFGSCASGARSLADEPACSRSSIEETAPRPRAQGAYLNQMFALETASTCGPPCRAACVERAAGREGASGGAHGRSISTLCSSPSAVAEPRLTVPHPELANRDFWVRELAELGVKVTP